MIKYLGSKRVLVPTIGALFRASRAQTALDLFTGTTRVAQEFCRSGAFTYAVDTATYSEILGQCYVEADSHQVDLEEVHEALRHLSSLPPKRGYVTEVFSETSRYFHPHNGQRIDAIRDGIEESYANSPLYPILLTSLLEAADRVDSTVGLQMAYLKSWAPRALQPMELRVPKLTAGTGKAIRGDSSSLANSLPRVDFAYLDPPYNQHRYFTNYHVWETLVRWDSPDHYGIACKRTDSQDSSSKSPFNSKRKMPRALRQTVIDVNADLILLSFSDEGFVSIDDLVAMCSEREDHTEVLAFDSKRHVGAQIGIHNLAGEKVGTVGRRRNTEYLILSGEKDRVKEIIASSGVSSTR